MDREALRLAWTRYYSGRLPGSALKSIVERADFLEGRMRKLARFPDNEYHGIPKASLITALGMSLGVHRQLQWGLTSVSSGGRLKGGGGA